MIVIIKQPIRVYSVFHVIHILNAPAFKFKSIKYSFMNRQIQGFPRDYIFHRGSRQRLNKLYNGSGGILN